MAEGLRPARGVTAVVIAALITLSLVAASLRSIHQRVRDDRVRSHLSRGHARVSAGELAPAAAQFRAALALDRDNVEAGRTLAVTLLALGRMAESESHLRELLRQDPTDGALNRDLARIHAARGRQAEARTAYQRAIYGEWSGDAVAERTTTRFEFVDYLGRIGARQEVLPELLRLRAELPQGHTASARRLADLLVEQGAVDLARETLHAAALSAPGDVDLLAQLSDLEASAGQVSDARAVLRTAVDAAPERADLAERLRILDRVLALDPTLPRLGLVTRTRRARLLLAQVVEATRDCAAAPAAPLRDLRASAQARLRRARRPDAEAAEEDLALAARLWAAAPACHASSPDAQAVTQVLRRVSAVAETGT